MCHQHVDRTVVGDTTTNSAQPEEAVKMTTTRRITTTFAIAIALAAGATPAVARPFDLDASGSYVPAGNPNVSATPPPSVVHVTTNPGFDWGDAGIGAAGGIALSMVGLAGAVGVSRHRARRVGDSTALTS